MTRAIDFSDSSLRNSWETFSQTQEEKIILETTQKAACHVFGNDTSFAIHVQGKEGSHHFKDRKLTLQLHPLLFVKPPEDLSAKEAQKWLPDQFEGILHQEDLKSFEKTLALFRQWWKTPGMMQRIRTHLVAQEVIHLRQSGSEAVSRLHPEERLAITEQLFEFSIYSALLWLTGLAFVWTLPAAITLQRFLQAYKGRERLEKQLKLDAKTVALTKDPEAAKLVHEAYAKISKENRSLCISRLKKIPKKKISTKRGMPAASKAFAALGATKLCSQIYSRVHFVQMATMLAGLFRTDSTALTVWQPPLGALPTCPIGSYDPLAVYRHWHSYIQCPSQRPPAAISPLVFFMGSVACLLMVLARNTKRSADKIEERISTPSLEENVDFLGDDEPRTPPPQSGWLNRLATGNASTVSMEDSYGGCPDSTYKTPRKYGDFRHFLSALGAHHKNPLLQRCYNNMPDPCITPAKKTMRQAKMPGNPVTIIRSIKAIVQKIEGYESDLGNLTEDLPRKEALAILDAFYDRFRRRSPVDENLNLIHLAVIGLEYYPNEHADGIINRQHKIAFVREVNKILQEAAKNS